MYPDQTLTDSSDLHEAEVKVIDWENDETQDAYDELDWEDQEILNRWLRQYRGHDRSPETAYEDYGGEG